MWLSAAATRANSRSCTTFVNAWPKKSVATFRSNPKSCLALCHLRVADYVVVVSPHCPTSQTTSMDERPYARVTLWSSSVPRKVSHSCVVSWKSLNIALARLTLQASGDKTHPNRQQIMRTNPARSTSGKCDHKHSHNTCKEEQTHGTHKAVCTSA